MRSVSVSALSPRRFRECELMLFRFMVFVLGVVAAVVFEGSSSE